MSDETNPIANDQSRTCRTHAAKVRIRLSFLENPCIRAFQCMPQGLRNTLGDTAGKVLGLDDRRRQPGRRGTATVPAHAVGNDHQLASSVIGGVVVSDADDREILILSANKTDVGLLRNVDGQTTTGGVLRSLSRESRIGRFVQFSTGTFAVSRSVVDERMGDNYTKT